MFANLGKYMLFIIRRERINSLVWAICLTAFTISMALLYPNLFPNKEALANMWNALNTPAMIAMMGPLYGSNSLTLSISMAQQCMIWIAIAVIVMNILFVNRHTRADEELGRHQILTSLPIGRLSGPKATIELAFLLNLTIAIISALGLIATGLDGMSVAGAFSYTLSLAAQGTLFAAITLLTAQLFSTSKGCLGVAFAILGLSYVLRANGDMSDNVLSIISPLGLGLRIQAFYKNDFLPVIFLYIEAIVVTGIAFWFNLRRDIGAGVFPAKKGKAHASFFLRSPFGFAWRLSRGSFFAWGFAIFIMSAMYGSVIGELGEFAKGNDVLQQILGDGSGSSIAEEALPMLCGVMALIATVPVIGTITRIYGEEKRHRIEQIYATSVSRKSIFTSFIGIAIIESIVFTLLSAIGLYVTSYSANIVSFKTIAGASFIFVPAMLTLAGQTALFVGIAPKLTVIVWALFGYSFFVLYFGRLFNVPKWAVNISPFGTTPILKDVTARPLIVLCIIAIVLGVIGFYGGYKKRDIKG